MIRVNACYERSVSGITMLSSLANDVVGESLQRW